MRHAASGVMAAQILKYVDSSTKLMTMKTKSYNLPEWSWPQTPFLCLKSGKDWWENGFSVFPF